MSGIPERVAACSLMLWAAGCGARRTVTERFVFQSEPAGASCSMTWMAGDYWEFVAWAVLDDPAAAGAMALAAGFTPDLLPSPGQRITLPLQADMQEALENRLAAGRRVREAGLPADGSTPEVMERLLEALALDPAWSVPRTNIALLLLQRGDPEGARAILEPVAHKYTPALLLSMLDWEEGCTESALARIAEAMSDPSPPPETLAAAGVIYTVTGETYLAAMAWRRILENPDAPSALRVKAMEMLLRE